MNQSIIVQIPKPPQVKSLPTPIPVSPIIKRSIPREPAKIETIKLVSGSFNCNVEIIAHLESSMANNLSLIK